MRTRNISLYSTGLRSGYRRAFCRAIVSSGNRSTATRREQPFGGYLSDFREVNGYRLPMRVEGGNLIGTGDYLPF
jgi:hypothetical protein